MAGLLNPAAVQQQSAPDGAPSQASAETLHDPILKQIEQGIEEKIPAEMKDAYLAIVVAGMQIMFSKETSKLMDQTLAMPGDQVTNISQGVAKLMILIYNESKKGAQDKGGMDVRMAVPAAITLLCQALDYWEATKGGQVTPEVAAEATKQTMKATLKAFGIGEDKIAKTIEAGQQQGGAADPGAAPAAGPDAAAPQPQMGV